jgi:hypothetical protein
MPLSPKQSEAKITTVLSAWETLRPTKTFAGLTLAQFKTAVQPSIDARTAITALDHQLVAAQDQRDDADIDSVATVLLVVNAVKGDPAEGEDGELYEAMGYVRKSERRSGLSRGKKTLVPTP